MSAHTAAEFFRQFPMRRVRANDLDAALGESGGALGIVFLWGHDCPNCDVAKREILRSADRFRALAVNWAHGNVYEEPELATRFGLHGIPTFLVFRGTRKIGRITPWPGTDAFVAVIERQIDIAGAA